MTDNLRAPPHTGAERRGMRALALGGGLKEMWASAQGSYKVYKEQRHIGQSFCFRPFLYHSDDGDDHLQMNAAGGSLPAQ